MRAAAVVVVVVMDDILCDVGVEGWREACSRHRQRTVPEVPEVRK